MTNRSLLKIIKTRLEGVKGAWPKELPNVLWAYRTTTRVPIGETPFRLTFGIEAVIPMEIGLTKIRVKAYKEQRNHQELNNNLDLIDEVRDKALKWMEKVGDLVLRKVSQETKDSSQGKLGPALEGPTKSFRHSREGSYYLKTLDGQELPRPWNIKHLKRYYQ